MSINIKELDSRRWEVVPLIGHGHRHYNQGDPLTNYDNADESWRIWYNRVGQGNIFRYGNRYTITARYRGRGWVKGWFDSFDAAALAVHLYVMQVRYEDYCWNIRNRRYAAKKKRLESKLAALRP